MTSHTRVDAYVRTYGELPYAHEARQLGAIAHQGMLGTPVNPVVLITSESPGSEELSAMTSDSPPTSSRGPRAESQYFTPTSLTFQDPFVDPPAGILSRPESTNDNGLVSRWSDETEYDAPTGNRHELHSTHVDENVSPEGRPSPATTAQASPDPAAASEGDFDSCERVVSITVHLFNMLSLGSTLFL